MKCFAMAVLIALFSLDDCIEYALQASPEVVHARIDAEKSLAMLKCSRLEYLPSLNIYLNQYFNWGRSVDMQELIIIKNRITKQSGASVGTSLTIYDGMRRVNGTAYGKESLMSARWALKAKEMEIKGEVTRAYLECLLAKALQKSLESVHGSTLEKSAIVEELYRNGSVTRSALLEMRAQAASEEASIVQASNETECAKEHLAALMGYNPDECSFDVCDADTVQFIHDDCCRLTLTAARSPGICALEHRIRAEEYAVKVARGLLQPSIAVTGAYGTYYSDLSPSGFKSQLRENGNPSLTFSLSLPLFAGGSVIRDIRTAEASLESARASLSQAILDMETVLNTAERELTALAGKVESDREYMRLCLEKENVAAEGIAAGTVSASDFIEARKETIQSRREYLCSLYNYLFQKKIIEHYNSYDK